MSIRGQCSALTSTYERPVTSEVKMIIMIAQVVIVLLVARSVDTADENGVDREILDQELELLREDFRLQIDDFKDTFRAEVKRLRRKDRKNLQQLENNKQKIIQLQTIVDQLRKEQKSLHELPLKNIFEDLSTEKRTREDIKNLKTAVEMCSYEIESLRAEGTKIHMDQQEGLSGLQFQISERCVYPPRPKNGQAEVEGRFHGDKVRYTCNLGYLLIGARERNCSNGNWTGTKPSCEPMECFNEPANPENGQADVKGRFHGDKMRYTCDPGYLMIGPEQRTCFNGNWTGTKPSCKPMECVNTPANPENGQADVKGRFRGDKVRYTCNPGYLLIGAQERNCSNGYWTGTKPFCKPIECFNKPANPENGQAEVEDRFRRDKVRYTCNLGYLMIGAQERDCFNGSWTGTKPSCEPMECFINLANPESGTWTDRKPSCEPTQFPQLGFTGAYGHDPDHVVIEEAGAVVTDGPERAYYTTVRTNVTLTAGRHYWELSFTWSVGPGLLWPDVFVAAVGVRRDGYFRDGSDFSDWIGMDRSWGVRIQYNLDLSHWRYEYWHGDKAIFTSKPVIHDGRSDVTNRLGLLLDIEKQTLVVIDINNNSSLFSFSTVDGSKPFVPVVQFAYPYFQRRFRLRATSGKPSPTTWTTHSSSIDSRHPH